MITDEQYRELEKRVETLEERLKQLSRQYSTLYMKRGIMSEIQPETKARTKKDTTKYVFNGKTCCKRQLVLECVSSYVNEHQGISSKELKVIFPDYIQGSLGVVKAVNDAEAYSNAHRRFYFGDNEILNLIDGKYVVCAQWDKHNIENFIAIAKDLGFNVVEEKKRYTRGGANE